MLSSDLAALYGVQPRALVQAVKRNRERFPEDFMFQLNPREFANLKSQIVISSWEARAGRYRMLHVPEHDSGAGVAPALPQLTIPPGLA